MERAFTIGDLVKRRNDNRQNKLQPYWDGPFRIRGLAHNNTYQLETTNGYVLRTLVNGERLQLFKSNSSDPALWYASNHLLQQDKLALQKKIEKAVSDADQQRTLKLAEERKEKRTKDMKRRQLEKRKDKEDYKMSTGEERIVGTTNRGRTIRLPKHLQD